MPVPEVFRQGGAPRNPVCTNPHGHAIPLQMPALERSRPRDHLRDASPTFPRLRRHAGARFRLGKAVPAQSAAVPRPRPLHGIRRRGVVLPGSFSGGTRHGDGRLGTPLFLFPCHASPGSQAHRASDYTDTDLRSHNCRSESILPSTSHDYSSRLQDGGPPVAVASGR